MAAEIASNAGVGKNRRSIFNPWEILCEEIPSMIDEIQSAREDALATPASKKLRPNHRDFYVGAGVLAVSGGTGSSRSRQREVDINTMPTKGGSRVCAEKRVVERVKKSSSGLDAGKWIVGIVIIGEAQPDKATGNDPDTLWPCGESCYPDIFASVDDVDNPLEPDTLVVTINTDMRKRQVQTVAEMNGHYELMRDGHRPEEPLLVDRMYESWHGTLDRFLSRYPDDLNPLASPDNRAVAVEAARLAILNPQLYVV
jgi:hypothetical protein